MTNAAVDVALRLRLQDQATPGLDKAARRAEENERKGAEVSEQAQRRMRASYQATSQAREVLGVRSEQRIQREIAATESAYKRLMATGKLSATEQARALDATRAKVTALTNEMGKLTAEQQKQAKQADTQARGSSALQYGGMAVAAGAAGYLALRAPVQQAMAVDERLAHLANTAYRERDVRGKRVGMDAMRSAVDSATDSFGGTRAGATGALEELMASGTMTAEQALKVLPSLVKAGTAANADPTQLAQIGIRAMQTFRIDPKDVPNVLNMALAAGQAGGFELKDMAKWLPQQMAAASMTGMSGRDGFAKLAALNQAAAITAGNKDEAGNNVVNLLSKINSRDTAVDAQKLGIDLPRYLQERRAKGVDGVDAFGELVDKTVAGRDDYKALQKQLANSKNEGEKRAALESMATIAQGAGIGTLIQDRQALMALLGMMNNREYMGRVLAEVKASDRGAGGAIDNNFELIAGTGAYKARRRGENVQAAQDRTLGDGGSALGAFNDFVADVSAKFPVLAGSTALAATSVTAMSGAAGLAAIALARVGGAGGLPGLGGGRGGLGSPGRGGAGTLGTGAGTGAGGRGTSILNRYGAAVGLGVAGTVIGSVAGEESVIGRYGKSAAEFAAVGTLFGPLGAAIGGATGLLVQGIKDLKTAGEKDRQAQEVQKMQATVQVEFADINDRLVARVARQKMETSDNVMAMFSTGNIMTGAPL
jgi:hypothetical protein